MRGKVINKLDGDKAKVIDSILLNVMVGFKKHFQGKQRGSEAPRKIETYWEGRRCFGVPRHQQIICSSCKHRKFQFLFRRPMMLHLAVWFDSIGMLRWCRHAGVRRERDADENWSVYLRRDGQRRIVSIRAGKLFLRCFLCQRSLPLKNASTFFIY